jgi:hypothetical protein
MQEAHPYDTIILHPGLYKQKVLCEIPLKIVSLGAYVSSYDREMSANQSRAAHETRLAPGTSVEHAPTPLHKGLEKSLVLCDVGTKDTTLLASGPPLLPCPVSSNTVTLWQERPPAVLSNCDAICLAGLTLRVVHASHEYSAVAFGPDSRSITLEGCHIMGHTGLRIPYAQDPLKILQMNLFGCVVQVCERLPEK